jgi:uncharacterized protein (TIGR02246 family)
MTTPVPRPATHDHAAIQATIDTMTAAFAAHDIDGILATYEPGAVVVGEPGRPVSGETALRALFAAFIALDPTFTFFRHEIVQAGDIAVHLNTWRLDGRGPDGAPIEQKGLSIAVLRRQPDGRWLMAIDHPFGDTILGDRT